MVCVCKDGKRKYQSLGISIKAEQRDFKTNQQKRNSYNLNIEKRISAICIANKKINAPPIIETKSSAIS